MRSTTPIVVGAATVVILAAGVGFGWLDAPTVLLALLLIGLVVPVCNLATTPLDPWLWWVASAAFLAKLVGSAARYFILVDVYNGVGDAAGYHSSGAQLAQIWRSGQIPGLGGGMGEGTEAVRWVTGLLYVPHTPSMLGGFLMFATLAFFGQLLFYCAFRRAVPEARLGIYAFFIFFLPTMVFWPSSIGKESLMILCLGIASYALGRAFENYSPTWLLTATAGLLGAGWIRPHIAALLIASFTGAVLLGRSQWWGKVGVKRSVVLATAAVLAVISVVTFADRYGLENTGDIDPFVADIQQHTQQGGSAVSGQAVFSITALPAATLRVLFRPFPTEADNLQALASSVEGTALLLLIVWRIPAMLKRFRRVRTPYLLMSAAFSIGFVIAFSTVLNLGILARQRSQVLPFLLAVVVALGWDSPDREVEPGRGKHLAVTG